jgi:putative transposase
VDVIKAEWKVPLRCACSVLKIDRSLYVYKSKRGEQAELKLRFKNICKTRMRYGYRRVQRDGWPINPK